MVSAREIVGKRITGIRYKVEPRGSSSGGPLHYDVEIVLDDGSVLVFVTEESASGDTYGIWVGKRMPARASRA
jgi:hypothetical protein